MDKTILTDIKKGDQDAFAALYHKYAGYALRVAIAITGNKANAADAVQETFLRVYKNISSFDVEKPFEPWLYRILINECNRILSKTSGTIFVESFSSETLHQSKADHYEFEEYETLYRSIERLEDANKIPIILRYLKGFKETEIAEILGINVNTIKSRIFKGRQKLKHLIENFEGGNQKNDTDRR